MYTCLCDVIWKSTHGMDVVTIYHGYPVTCNIAIQLTTTRTAQAQAPSLMFNLPVDMFVCVRMVFFFAS